MVRAEAFSPKPSPGRDSAAEITKLNCTPPRLGMLPTYANTHQASTSIETLPNQILRWGSIVLNPSSRFAGIDDPTFPIANFLTDGVTKRPGREPSRLKLDHPHLIFLRSWRSLSS